MDHRPCGLTRRGLIATGVVAALVGTAGAASAAPEDTPAIPENVIVFIGDGMGYNHIASTNLYETGQSRYQVFSDAQGGVKTLPGNAVQVYEDWALTNMTTFQHGNSYDPERAWTDFAYIAGNSTDSGAAGTAMGTGAKTNNGVIGLDHEGNRVENLTERAKATGRAAGVVTSVPFNHATPAGYVAHNGDRNDYVGMATEMLGTDLDVVMGAGHPGFTDSGEARETPSYDYISEGDFARLQDGQTGFSYVEEKADFEALAAGEDVPERVFGLAQVASTLQQGRASDGEETAPYQTPLNDNVPSLETMTAGALNVLEQDEDGLFLMVEGGAIDWTGHANDTVRNIEETQDFNASVEAAVEWVESEDTDATWDNTLIIVTADHETGYLAGAGSDPGWTPMHGDAEQLPTLDWYSGSHTNQLVPVFAKGVGVDTLLARATGTDPVRGEYLDNTDLANVLLDELWATQPSEDGIEVEAVIPELGDGEGPGLPGTLVLSVADGKVALGDLRHAGDRLRLDGELPTVSVTDSRAEAAGWAVSGQASSLVSADERVIRAGHLGWTPGLVEEQDGVTPGERVRSVMSGGEGLAAAQTLAYADAEGRIGTAVLDADLELEVPVDTRDGAYTGSLTVTLFPVD
ncbi:alkaline phosphatase [Oceanitalea stevensii]|uniref:Alkaline phosphatase n=1 Tax=Oceanitalea stevensii TaxID=2763072 RepID=A0ABR8Z4V3_9MICO|nr:alkaline phosphatase [Oceanitalea stevensii]MBD8063352.1 alkaline phosphatase [Oceanitalea stevensii]